LKSSIVTPLIGSRLYDEPFEFFNAHLSEPLCPVSLGQEFHDHLELKNKGIKAYKFPLLEHVKDLWVLGHILDPIILVIDCESS
jgi:hypothetical protein